MRTKRISGLIVVFSVCMFVGCADTRREQGKELQSWVQHLTPMVVAVCDRDEKHQIPDEQLFNEAVKNKPKYRAAFKNNKVKVKRDGTNVVVLVCDRDGKYALWEVASWQGGETINWSTTRNPQPAEFTIKLPNKGTPEKVP